MAGLTKLVSDRIQDTLGMADIVIARQIQSKTITYKIMLNDAELFSCSAIHRTENIYCTHYCIYSVVMNGKTVAQMPFSTMNISPDTSLRWQQAGLTTDEGRKLYELYTQIERQFRQSRSRGQYC